MLRWPPKSMIFANNITINGWLQVCLGTATCLILCEFFVRDSLVQLKVKRVMTIKRLSHPTTVSSTRWHSLRWLTNNNKKNNGGILCAAERTVFTKTKNRGRLSGFTTVKIGRQKWHYLIDKLDCGRHLLGQLLRNDILLVNLKQ